MRPKTTELIEFGLAVPLFVCTVAVVLPKTTTLFDILAAFPAGCWLVKIIAIVHVFRHHPFLFHFKVLAKSSLLY